MSQKWNISAGEMYSVICVQWATDHFGLGLLTPFKVSLTTLLVAAKRKCKHSQ